ncbi:MAG: amidohydrolase family protein [Gemmatimonadetes bacterium]|nr:amidohydrolase family protein [Gemmatimonadota bacterium]
MRFTSRPALLAFTLLLALPAAAQEGETPLVIRAARLIIGTDAPPVLNPEVVIEGERITAVGPTGAIPIPRGATVIDLSGHTILPGLFDCHVHLGGIPGDGGDTQKMRETVAHEANYAVAHAKITLEKGFTSVRNIGAGNYHDAALRDMVDRGIVPGPRIQAATWGVGSTGGHADINGWNPDVPTPGYAMIADGVDELRRAVRFQVKYGADVIKVTASGGVLSHGDSVHDQAYSFEELKAIVDTATMLDTPVGAHAHSPAAMNDAIRAGVASIEHGTLIDDEGIRLAKEHGTFIVPTIYTLDFIIEEGAENGVPEHSIVKAQEIATMQRERLAAAFHAGVKFAYGTDAAVFPHGRNAKDFGIMVDEMDISPMAAIQTATINGAELLGWEADLGSIEDGKLADIIAVAGNPLDDIRLLEDVRFVMKGGEVVKSP